jgi:hypothetical protein
VTVEPGFGDENADRPFGHLHKRRFAVAPEDGHERF